MYSIKIQRGISSEEVIEASWRLYSDNLEKSVTPVQSKPYFSKEEFANVFKKESFIKALIYKNGLVGFVLFVENVDEYPDSHFAREFFSGIYRNRLIINWDQSKTLFAVGDRCGIVLDIYFFDKFDNKEALNDILKNVFLALKNYMGREIIVVTNYSEHADTVTKLHHPYHDPVNAIKKQFNWTHLDTETFVNIHWLESAIKRSRLRVILKLLSENKSLKLDKQENESVIYRTKKIFGRGYIVKKMMTTQGNLAEEIHSNYHERLAGVNSKSPQKLEYDKKTFIGYLNDPGYVKYLLYTHESKLVGSCILISKEQSDRASWISPSWRVSDAYVKLIYVNRGEAAFVYLILFASSVYDLLKSSGQTSNARVLADWSDLINGEKFRNSLNITPIPFLPNLINAKTKPDRIFASVIIKIANFRATLLDNDIYLAIKV